MSGMKGLIEAVRRHERGRYPAELRQRITEHVHEQQLAGQSLATLSAVLGVPAQTLARWSSARRPGGFVEVRPIRPSAPGAVTVVTPEGWRIEGLDVESTAALLQRLFA